MRFVFPTHGEYISWDWKHLSLKSITNCYKISNKYLTIKKAIIMITTELNVSMNFFLTVIWCWDWVQPRWSSSSAGGRTDWSLQGEEKETALSTGSRTPDWSPTLRHGHHRHPGSSCSSHQSQSSQDRSNPGQAQTRCERRSDGSPSSEEESRPTWYNREVDWK